MPTAPLLPPPVTGAVTFTAVMSPVTSAVMSLMSAFFVELLASVSEIRT
jgi:hypothetical protein